MIKFVNTLAVVSFSKLKVKFEGFSRGLFEIQLEAKYSKVTFALSDQPHII